MALLLAAAMVFSLLFGPLAPPVAAQDDEPTQVVADTLIDTVQAQECTDAGCRNTRITAALFFNPDKSRALNEEQAAAAQREFDNAQFKIVVDPEGGEPFEVESGDTICLEPGSYTVAATIVNSGSVKSAVAKVLRGLGVEVDANDIVINGKAEVFGIQPCYVTLPPTGDRPQSEALGGSGSPDVRGCRIILGQYTDIDQYAAGDASEIAQQAGVSIDVVQNCIVAGEDAVVDLSSGEVAELPDTGGASIFALIGGAVLVGGGLLARRYGGR